MWGGEGRGEKLKEKGEIDIAIRQQSNRKEEEKVKDITYLMAPLVQAN